MSATTGNGAPRIARRARSKTYLARAELTAGRHTAQASSEKEGRAMNAIVDPDMKRALEQIAELKRRGHCFGVWAMAGRYFDRLRKLSGDFDAAFALRQGADLYAWSFLDDYDLAELVWLYQEQTALHGHNSVRCALLKRKLVKRGIAA